jgi:hypothetical protein
MIDPPPRGTIVTSNEKTVGTIAQLIGRIPGAVSFELRYCATNRDLADNEEPLPTDTVQWDAVARILHVDPDGDDPPTIFRFTGSDTVPPGGSNNKAAITATIRLAEQLGINTIVVDYTDDKDPRDGD